MEVKPLEVWRTEKFLTQTELAKAAEVDQAVISRLENRHQKAHIGLKAAKRVADVLGVDARQIEQFQHLFSPKDLAVTEFSDTARRNVEEGMPVLSSTL